MTRTPAILALGLLLALAPGAAAEPATLTAVSLLARGPDAGELHGDLAALVIDDTLQQVEPVPLPPFTVSARQMHVETDVARPSVHAGAASARAPPRTESSDWTDATLQQVAERGGYHVDVLEMGDAAAPRASLEDGCFDLGTYEKSSIDRDPVVSGDRPTPTILLGNAVRASRCGTVVVTITGSFQLRLWQADAILTAGGSSRVLRSGAIGHPALEGQPVQASEDREIYVQVRDGTFRSPFSNATRLFLRGVEGVLDGAVVLGSANGRVPTGLGSDETVQDRTIELRGGPMRVAIQGHGPDPMQVSLDGDWTAGAAAAPAGTGESAPAPPALLALAALALAAAARRRRQRRARR